MRVRSLLCLMLAAVFLLLVACASGAKAPALTVRIAVPDQERLSGMNSGYYVEWLEAQTGLDIVFEYIPQTYTEEYLRMLFEREDSDLDAVFFSKSSAPSAEQLEVYAAQGRLRPLEDLIDTRGEHLNAVFENFSDYDLRQVLVGRDEHIYYMPALDTSETDRYTQTMWINILWLEALRMPIPTTTDEFVEVMRAFAKHAPQGVPLIGSPDEENTFVCNFLINAFVTCDPYNGYMAVEDGEVFFAPATDAWREALRYCRALYDEGLLPAQNFSFSTEQFVGIANDPRMQVGCFTGKTMSTALSENSPELLSRFFYVPPLQGPGGVRSAVVEAGLPRPGGVILASSQNAEAVFDLMDLMVGEEAFLIGHYGEPDVDWAAADVGDISVTGEPAVISIKNNEWRRGKKAQPSASGPYVMQAKYADGIAWKGFQTNQSESLKARAFRSYDLYAPEESLHLIVFEEDAARYQDLLGSLSAVAKRWMIRFITGDAAIESDSAWAVCQADYARLGLDELLPVVQACYDRP